MQAAFWAVATAALTTTAPDHGGQHSDGFYIAPALAIVAAGTLLLGFWIARRTGDRAPAEA